ncbi:pectate lyase [Micromonospora deserti]|uniref:pectate lyase n=1 Tax=Micromonospora deserti TaxID=2070366 RepID=A0A2W2EA44_9ACTN|nr:pectate lyase [Micromonospora deserti]PZG01734.1 pectate lyase [Micromonospora deserti]
MKHPTRTRRRWRAAVLATVTLTAAGVLTAIGATGASAATIDTNAWYQLVSRHSGKAIDVCGQSTADRACIQQWDRANQANQQFQFVSSGSGYYRLKARHSGKVIDVLDWSTADGASLIQWPDTNGANQQWRVIDTDSGYVKLINRHSGKAMDVWEWSTGNGGRISQYTDTSGRNQQWQLNKVDGGGSPTTPPPSGGWPTPTGQASVDGTVRVDSGEVRDGGMRRYCCIGDGSQEESQDPMFVLEDGATLQNVIIGAPAGDGIHCEGDCTIRNVWWEDVGEDAATFRGGSNYYVIGGGARRASDKVFQHNGSGTVHISGFYAEDIGKLYRACGNCSTSHQRHTVIDNVTVRNADAVAGINVNWGDTARFTRITIYGDADVCQKWEGAPKGEEPTLIGTGADGVHCIYRESDITRR